VISIRNRASLPNILAGRLACAALALCLPASAWAETLADAVAAAYDRNPQLVQQRYLQKARDENVVQARSQYGPMVTAQTQGQRDYFRQPGLSGRVDQGHGDQQETTIQIQQPLYTSGRLRGQLAAAQAGMLGGREELRLVEQQVVQDVIQVYAAVLRDEARVAIGRENVEILQVQLRQNAKRQQVGDVTLTDVAQSDARLAAAELQLATLEANLAVSRGQYLQVVGHNPGRLDPLPQLGALPPTIDAAFDIAEQNNPNLNIAQYTESQSSANAAATRGSGGPTISAFGQGISTNNTLLSVGGRSATKQAIAGFTISQPLFSSGLIRSQVREADARNRADQAGIDIARRTVMQSVTSAWVQLSASRVAVTTGQRQVESAQQAFAGMSCEELNGLRAPIETLNAEAELQSAELQLVQNRFQVYVSHAALLAATGVLSAQQIADGITVYDPEANFQRVRYAGSTPLEFFARGLDRIGSAGPRGPFSTDLAGRNVPHPENPGALASAPSRALMNKALTPLTESKLRLPNGDTARCPLNDGRAR
jgi:TolC family type I secretion outer membrane protein